MSFAPLLRLALLASVCALPLGAQIVAPCPYGDDGLDVGCCAAVPQVNIPSFGTVETRSSYGCRLDCRLEREFLGAARFDYDPRLCDTATIVVSVTPGPYPSPALRGRLEAKYSRTFIETHPTQNVRVQVWRFLVNGDLHYGNPSSTTAPCPTPTEAVGGRPVHFFGSIDYRCDPSTPNRFDVRFDLSHLPDCVSHASWSTRPISPLSGRRSYHLVGPAPFTWTAGAPYRGPLTAESVRSSRVNWSPFAYRCLGEQPVRRAELHTDRRLCLACGPGPIPLLGNVHDQALRGEVDCGGVTNSFVSVPISGLSTAGLLAFTLGTHADGTIVHAHFGLLRHTDLCTGEGPRHFVAGTSTRHRGDIHLFGGSVGPVPSPRHFVLDLGNSLVRDTYPPSVGWGSPYTSTVVWQLND